MGTKILAAQNKWCNGLNSCQLQLFLDDVRLEYDEDDNDDDNVSYLVVRWLRRDAMKSRLLHM